MLCIRCGRSEKMERHHIQQRIHGGSDEPENMEDRCQACHDYEHTRRFILGSLEAERHRGQLDRIAVFEHRLAVLDKLNTVKLIQESGTYLSYWSDSSTHPLPRPVLTKKEQEVEDMIQLAFQELAENT